MLIVGYISPTHRERLRNVGGQTGELPEWVPVDKLLEIAYDADPHWSPWSYELISAAAGEVEDRGTNISSTALTSPCPRSLVLERMEDYVEDMDRLWRAFRGTMVHYVLEAAARPNSIAEVRFFAPVGEDVISCKPDLVTEDGQLWDYKNTAKVPRWNNPYPGNVEQLQFNRWIVNNAAKWEKNGEPYDLTLDVRNLKFNHLAIMYLDLDGPKPLEYMESIMVPTTSKAAKSKVKPMRLPGVWSDDRVMDILVPRFKALRAAFEMYPKFPNICEKVWGGPPTWECPGYPHCPLKGGCLASRYPKGLIW